MTISRFDVEANFLKRALSEPQQAFYDFDIAYREVKDSKAIYKGKPIPFLYMPKFFTQDDIRAFQNLLDQMMQLCHKMIHLYRTEPFIQQKYNFNERLHALVMKDSKYASKVPMGRFDIFYNSPKNFMFCELNTDGTSAMNEDAELARILGQTEIMEHMSEQYQISSFELFDTWVKEIVQIYKEAGGTKENPVIAIVDLFEKASSIEFEVFKERFEAMGYPCFIVDARHLSYDQGLYVGQTKIDIVYRRLVTKDMMEHIDELQAFEQACLDDITLVVGNIQSQIVHTKLFFALLHDEQVRPYFSSDELEFIDAHVPYTKELGHALQDPKGLEKMLEGKNEFLIKPLDFYASIGVYAGADYTQDQWRQILIDNADNPYLLQHFCVPPQSENINFNNEHDGIEVGQFKHITGLFVYNQKLHGVYSRAGRTSIISGLHDVFTIPSLFVQEL